MQVSFVWASAAIMLLSAPVTAKDTEACPADMICASRPGSVAGGLMRAGYQASTGKDGEGDPTIESAASGYKFILYFYGCEKAAACDSLQFVASFTNENGHGIDFANRWNKLKRFSQLSIADDGALVLRRDLSTMGGLNAKHFADEIEWWASMLGEFDRFLTAERKPAKTSAAPKA